MPLCKFDFFAEALDKYTSMNILLPEDSAGNFGVLYLLHGLGNTFEAWCKWTSLARYHRDYNFAIVMPEASTGWYCNDPRPGGHQWEDHIIKDVIPTVEKYFNAGRKRSNRVIAGMSMGGFGAMHLALNHSKLFSGVSGHASAFFFTHEQSRTRPHLTELAEAVGMNQRYDVFKLAALAAEQKHLPRIRFDCGKNDPLLSCNKKLHQHLLDLKIEHCYDEPQGIHDWAYGDQQIIETLNFAKDLLCD